MLTPSAEYFAGAGARIRYGRIAESMQALGGSLTLMPIEQFQPDVAECDAVLISKCHDARAIIAAIREQARGIQVGVDLFDDYFSQHGDSRMGRYRNWLAQLLPRLNFAVCSTPAMASVARSYRPDLPVHVMNDPAPPIDRERLRAVLERKRLKLLAEQTLDICWFGMGRNPHFPVGIRDLGTFGAMLGGFADHGIAARLTVLTNVTALDAENIAILNGLPLPVLIEPWSEAREIEVLETATVAFIPVNAQNFSVAKSLNRAWTALTAGCQVLSAGYPLYTPLQALIYRDAGALLDDLHNGRARLGAASVDALLDRHDELADAANEAAGLAAFVAALPPAVRKAPPLLALVHGAVTSGPIHKFAKSNGALTVRSPYCAADLATDVIFTAACPGDPLTVLLAERAQALASQHRPILWQPVPLDGYRAPEGSIVPANPGGNWSSFCMAAQLAANAAAAGEMADALHRLFGPLELVWSENSVSFPTPGLQA